MNRFFIKILCLVTALITLSLFAACDGLTGTGGEIRYFNDYNGTWECDFLTVTSDVQTTAYICGELRLEGSPEKDIVASELYSSYLRFYDHEKREAPKGYADVTAKLFDGEVTLLKDDSLKIKVVADYMYGRGETSKNLEGESFTLTLRDALNENKIKYSKSAATWSGEGMTVKSAPGEEIGVSGTIFLADKEYNIAIDAGYVYDLDTANRDEETGRLQLGMADRLLNVSISMLPDYSLKVTIGRDLGFYYGLYEVSHEGNEYILKLVEGTVAKD